MEVKVLQNKCQWLLEFWREIKIFMVSKLLIMGLMTAGTTGMEQNIMLIMIGKRKKDKDHVEAYLHCVEFDVHKE